VKYNRLTLPLDIWISSLGLDTNFSTDYIIAADEEGSQLLEIKGRLNIP